MHQFATAVQRKRHAGRVLKIRHRIDELGALRKERLNVAGGYAVRVEGDGHELGSERPPRGEERKVRWVLHHHAIARVDENAAEQIQGLLRTTEDGDLLAVDCGV